MGQFRELLIESPRGRGKIYDGDVFLSDCSYDLEVRQEIIVDEMMDGSLSRVPGNVETTGMIKPVLDLGKDHSLHLADGKILHFWFTDFDGTIQGNSLFIEP